MVQRAEPTAQDVRLLVRAAPSTRWQHLHLVHRRADDELEADVRHGELSARRSSDGAMIIETGTPPTSWGVRDLEPYYENYRWSAMLDPYELSEHVALTDLSAGELFGRPVWRFRARAENGYDPICSCCPLLFSDVSQRLEHGDAWVTPPGTELPEGFDLALDVQTGIIVSSRAVGGDHADWFDNEIVTSS